MDAWERGIDRLMDCEVLDDCSNSSMYGFVFNRTVNAHCVLLNEVFETFNCCFSVNYPDPDMHDNMTLIGHHKSIPTTAMMKDTEFTSWMPVKYGEPKNPFKISSVIENTSSGDNGQWKASTSENLVQYEY
jgi:hypothetical protein